ncbi:prepilin peptidase [Photobacterium minamisatsumaniensis]|uniref:prepilin peptidase n=1 Tax=Photobacterium minamisatsumaniensis TaxID=2910233 RepID=UPI003D0F35F1
MSLPIITLVFYAALYDIIYAKIPNIIVLAIIIIGILQTALSTSNISYITDVSFLNACLGFVIGLALCLALYYKKVFAAGDAKLLASLGFITGIEGAVLLVAVSIVFSGIISLLIVMVNGEGMQTYQRYKIALLYSEYIAPPKGSISSSSVPMGGAILLATLFCEFYLF